MTLLANLVAGALWDVIGPAATFGWKQDLPSLLSLAFLPHATACLETFEQ